MNSFAQSVDIEADDLSSPADLKSALKQLSEDARKAIGWNVFTHTRAIPTAQKVTAAYAVVNPEDKKVLLGAFREIARELVEINPMIGWHFGDALAKTGSVCSKLGWFNAITRLGRKTRRAADRQLSRGDSLSL